jgi:hypothetical protein
MHISAAGYSVCHAVVEVTKWLLVDLEIFHASPMPHIRDNICVLNYKYEVCYQYWFSPKTLHVQIELFYFVFMYLCCIAETEAKETVI